MKIKFFTRTAFFCMLTAVGSPMLSHAQSEYFRESFEAGHTFPITDVPAQYCTGANSGTWYVNGVFVTNGSAANNCTGVITTIGPYHARLRSVVPLPDTAYMVTPVLDYGVQNLNFINGRASRNISIWKTTDTLATTTNWTLVTFLASPPICELFRTVAINDPAAKRLKFQSRGDTDIDSVWITSTSPIPMPVTFSEISASVSNGAVKLSWNVETEVNTERYYIERSFDGSHFESVGNLNASASHKYVWFDNTIPQSENVLSYRVMAMDKDGKSTYSRVIGVKLRGKNAGFSVFPNPIVDKEAVIQLSDLDRGSYVLNVYDQSGKNVFTQKIENANATTIKYLRLPASLRSGIYVMSLTDGATSFSKTVLVK